MKTEIYYFSGTGNSLHVARELQKRLSEVELIPMAGTSETIRTGSGNVGFVFPCHGLTIPTVVRDFLKKADLSGSQYFFAIATRGGSIFRGFPVVEKILEKKSKRLNASFVITMGSNDCKMQVFKVPTESELNAIENNVQQKLALIEKTVRERECRRDDDGGETFSRIGVLNFILERLIPFMVHHLARRVKKYFYTDAKCAGCGTCCKVCPARKILLVDDKPFWQPMVDCHMCYACLNFCPKQAIQIHSKIWMKSYTQDRGRYPHPYATVGDIAGQKAMVTE